MPAEPPGFLTVFYVGVVPEMRGQGYVDDLLASDVGALRNALQARGIPNAEIQTFGSDRELAIRARTAVTGTEQGPVPAHT